jgi:hypothetical protein
MNEPVTLRSFNNAVEFEIAKSYLESFGIECYGRDEHINWAYLGNVDGGVKLDVSDEQAEEAIKLLLEGGYLKAEDFEPSPELKFVDKLLNFFRPKNK